MRANRILEHPLVTVATVAYNAEDYIGEAIASVLAQRFANFELLVLDDCSTDATWQVVSAFRDPRIRAIRNDPNIGEYANRNRALHLARGKYLIYIDGDDYLYPHGLGFMVEMIERFPRAAFASAQLPSEKFIYPVELTPHELCACLLTGPDVFGANFTQLLFRTGSLRRIGGFDERFHIGDTYAQCALAMREGCVLINGGLAWWRKHPQNASSRFLGNGLAGAEMVRFVCELLERVDCPLTPEERRKARALTCRGMLRRVVRHVVSGHIEDALQLLRVSGVHLPDWRYLFTSGRRPYLAEVGGANPIRMRIAPSTRAAPAAGHAVHAQNRIGYAMRSAVAFDRLPARRNNIPVVNNHVPSNGELRI